MMRKVFLALLWVGVSVLALAVATRRAVGAVEGVHSVSVAVGQLGPVKPMTWTLVGQRIGNESGQSAEVLAATSFHEAPYVQFAQPVWIPPHSVRRIWLPVRSGPSGPDKRAFAVESLLLDESGPAERQIVSGNAMRDEAPLMTLQAPLCTGIIDPADVDASRLLSPMYKAQESKFIADYLRPDAMPVVSAALDNFDTILIASTPQLEMAQIQALRHWLVSGGKLWVMADTVDENFLRVLLGEDWNVQIIDRTELETFVIDRPGGEKESHAPESAAAMVHFVAPDMETICSVNGYPAALRKKIGHGQLLVTTLGLSGWLKEDGKASAALGDLGSWFLTPRQGPVLAPPVLRHNVQQQIGRQTVGRTPVLCVLGGYCLALLAAGVVTRISKRAEYGAVAGIVLAVAATGGLIAMGSVKQHAVPLTVAGLQVADVVPGQRLIVSSGMVGFYSPSLLQDTIASDRGILWPDFDGSGKAGSGGGQLARLVWTDTHKWQWQHVGIPAGSLRMGDVSATITPTRLPQVTGTFGPDGFSGQLDPGDFTDLSDAIVLAPAGRFALGRPAPPTFHVSDETELPAGQFLSANVLSDTQRQHQEIYQILCDRAHRSPDPILLGWTHLCNSDIELPRDFRRAEATVLRIPLQIAPPAPHAAVAVPAGFIPFRVVSLPTKKSMPIFTAVGEWVPDLTNGGEYYLRFDLPAAVAGLHVSTMHLRILIQAPGRAVDVLNCQGPGEPRRMFTRQGPQDPIDKDLADTFAVQPDPAGHITLGMRVGPSADPNLKWTMRDIRLSVTGQMP